jgi:antitoxin (DNA-binding transcriptional repressor) of toxin-antitoxin stability system
MQEVQAPGEPVAITERGIPIVKIVPVDSVTDAFGFMVGEFKIGDIESPVASATQKKATSRYRG